MNVAANAMPVIADGKKGNVKRSVTTVTLSKNARGTVGKNRWPKRRIHVNNSSRNSEKSQYTSTESESSKNFNNHESASRAQKFTSKAPASNNKTEKKIVMEESHVVSKPEKRGENERTSLFAAPYDEMNQSLFQKKMPVINEIRNDSILDDLFDQTVHGRKSDNLVKHDTLLSSNAEILTCNKDGCHADLNQGKPVHEDTPASLRTMFHFAGEDKTKDDFVSHIPHVYQEYDFGTTKIAEDSDLSALCPGYWSWCNDYNGVFGGYNSSTGRIVPEFQKEKRLEDNEFDKMEHFLSSFRDFDHSLDIERDEFLTIDGEDSLYDLSGVKRLKGVQTSNNAIVFDPKYRMEGTFRSRYDYLGVDPEDRYASDGFLDSNSECSEYGIHYDYDSDYSEHDTGCKPHCKEFKVDFHNHGIQEAKEKLIWVIKSLPELMKSYHKVSLIVGKGKHSRDGVPAIKLMAKKMLSDYNIPYVMYKKNTGAICIYTENLFYIQ